MMQQPVFQQEQAGNQGQQQQQMLLCPVRLVYETQILVQPGDQIQPNQTIVINPQNQPPWAQNRIQNQQVIYVQNVPNNFMPQMHQLDQNQMFLQQNYTFPQVIQHQMIAPNQEQMRALQMGNVPAHMQPQMQANVARVMPNERMMTHNFSQVQMNPAINVPTVVQNQIANVPISANNRQIPNVPKTISEMPNNQQKSQEVQISTPQNYRHLTHQAVTPQMNISRTPAHQTIAMIPVPNMVHRAPNIESNTGQISNMPQPAIIQASNPIPPTFANNTTPNVQLEPRKGAPIMQKGPNQNTTNTMNHTPKNSSYSYRPIQPRPQQFRSNAPSNAMTVQPNMNIQIQSSSNVVDGNRIMGQNIVNTNYQKMDNSNHHFNRKRKSESPDEMHRKLTIAPAAQTTATSTMTVKRIEAPTVSNSVSLTKVNTHEIGVNTNPIIKMNSKISTNNRNMIQISPLVDQNAKIKEELAKPLLSIPQTVIPPMTITNITNNSALPNLNTSQIEKEKFVRNTVFTQARFGRLLTDKDDIPVNINSLAPKETKNTEIEKDNKIAEEIKIKNAPKTETNTVNEVKTEHKSKKKELKEEKSSSALEVKEAKPAVVERSAEEKMLSDSMNRLKGPEANEIKLKNEKDYILTHVLDGFVIQESNVAFPIRLPLKEKSLGFNTGMKSKTNLKEEVSEVKDNKPDKVPDLSHLNLSENERLKGEEKMDVDTNEGNPFSELNHCTVKAWTVEQLATHLSKFNWVETITVLQEHEIDGESLFLVSKNQLISIGVKENHADVICEFVKS